MRGFSKRRRPRPLVLEVRDALERMILSGSIAAGERLNEISLAEQMGVSRGPVREAARSLEGDGLVRTVANQGVFVRKLSVEEALELYELRALIAGSMCARLAQAAGPGILDELRSLTRDMDAAIADGDEEQYFELNLDFHHRIAAASGMSRACRLYDSLGKEVRLLRHRVLTGDASLRLSNEEHHRIVDAIESGDADRANAEGADHHLNGSKRLLETLSREESCEGDPVIAAGPEGSGANRRLHG